MKNLKRLFRIYTDFSSRVVILGEFLFDRRPYLARIAIEDRFLSKIPGHHFRIPRDRPHSERSGPGRAFRGAGIFMGYPFDRRAYLSRIAIEERFASNLSGLWSLS